MDRQVGGLEGVAADPSTVERSRNRSAVRITLPVFVALVVWTSAYLCPVEAQSEAAVYVVPRPLVVVARRDLRFGTVIRGVSTTVLPSDVRGAGLFEINGSKHESVRIEFLLPENLGSDDGDALPIFFGPGDGAAATDMGRFHGVPFDPRQPLIATLGANGKLYVRLGGTVVPGHGQTAGTYRATVFLSVFDLGS